MAWPTDIVTFNLLRGIECNHETIGNTIVKANMPSDNNNNYLIAESLCHKDCSYHTIVLLCDCKNKSFNTHDNSVTSISLDAIISRDALIQFIIPIKVW